MYICKFYEIKELVPPEVYQMADESTLWMMFDERTLYIGDCLRNDYGIMTVNNWAWNGSRTMSGFRPWNTTVGADFSMHKFAKALDLHPEETEVDKIRKDILEQKKSYMKLIKGLELKVNWIHFDTRNASKLITFRR